MERNGVLKVSNLEIRIGFEGTVWKCEISQKEQSMSTGCSRVRLGNRNSLQEIENSQWDADMKRNNALSIYVVLYVCKGHAKWCLCSVVIAF